MFITPLQTSNNSALLSGKYTISYLAFGLTALAHKNWYTNEITKLHFTDALNGYVVGKTGLTRHTQDGGLTWKSVTPYLNSSGLPVDLYAVYTTTPDGALLGGNENYLAICADVTLNAPVSITGAILTERWNDIDFYSSTGGFVVGTRNAGGGLNLQKTLEVSVTNNVLAILATPSPTSAVGSFKSVYAFKSTIPPTFIAVGENGNMKVYDGSSMITVTIATVPPSLTTMLIGSGTINDVVFSNSSNGYLVGSGSKVANISLDPVTHTCTVSDMSPPNSGSGLSEYNTVALVGGTDGFLGGYRSNGSVSSKYGWKFTQESSASGGTRFWYDRLGRLIASQNSKQAATTSSTQPKAYSYTLYDALGRITEVGEKTDNTGSMGANTFTSTFGTYINNYLNTKAIDDNKFTSWINDNSGARREVTQTFYDIAPFASGSSCTIPLTQEYLRKRVASVTLESVYDAVDCTYDHATHYSYDIHGNVKSLLQDNHKLTSPSTNPLAAQRFKSVDYSYDLISGKVNQVSYQSGEADAFYHRYDYDADNRITQVSTSRNGLVWESDAKYFYYRHGPLARTELGHDKLQGIDYAYTLQGWLKGTNSNLLSPALDIGSDGLASSTNPNRYFGADAAGFTLGYYTGDYTPIESSVWGTTNRFEALTPSGSDLISNRNNLFNGNIGHMVSTLAQPSMSAGVYAQAPAPQGSSYLYDQLNRLTRAVSFTNLYTAGNSWIAGGSSNSYLNSFTYDGNGNILTQERRDAGGTAFDQLTYKYDMDGTHIKNNRLTQVQDAVPAYQAADDIDDQLPDNYAYDNIGNLVQDNQENIQAIEWTVYGKIKAITRANNTNKDLKFDYDAQGNRVAKHLYTGNGGSWLSSTYYVRDAQGNVMSTYVNDVSGSAMSYRAAEYPIYGSDRLGMDVHPRELIGTTYDPTVYERYAGKKQFELKNHLGNVLAVVSDKKYKFDDGTGHLDHTLTDVLSTNDYYPFGAPIPDRSFTSGNYRYGFNGKENDDEVKGAGNSLDYGARIYDPRLGKFLSVDPLFKEYAYYTPYQFAGNTPIQAIDRDGLEPAYTVNKIGSPFPKIIVQGSSTIQSKIPDNAIIKGFQPPNATVYTSELENQLIGVPMAILEPLGESINTLINPRSSVGDKVMAAGTILLMGVAGEGEPPVGGMKNPKIKGVINETNAGKGAITSQFKLSESELLDAGIEHVGADATELGKAGSGVYRSKSQNADGSYNQFRIDENSLQGKHPFDTKGTKAPHGHLEKWNEGAPKPEVNNHIPVEKDK